MPSRSRPAKPIYILNGPNLNLLGTRQPEIYGSVTLEAIENGAAAQALKQGFTVVFRQTNSEGELVDWIQEAGTHACGLILNAGAYTHTSIAVMDALMALDIPIIEVHLSNLFRRERFRHRSFVSAAATGLICGLGAQGYLRAIDALKDLLTPRPTGAGSTSQTETDEAKNGDH